MCIYDPFDKTFEDGPRLPSCRSHVTTIMVENILYCFGGLDDEGNDLQNVEMYDCLSRTWRPGICMRYCKGMFTLLRPRLHDHPE